MCLPSYEWKQLVQALRAWLLSACPSGTKAIRPSKRHTIILALMHSTLGFYEADDFVKTRWKFVSFYF